MRRKRILTWHVHGNYLAYLARIDHDLLLPVRPGRLAGYGGRPTGFGSLENLHEVDAAALKHLELDGIIFQAQQHYLEDQHDLLTPEQRKLPRIYLEHDPPRAHPTDTRHPVDDPGTLLVHVTPFNDLMWDSNRTPTTVIEHGVVVPEQVRYGGELPRGVVVVNHLAQRGRRLGYDVFERVRQVVPLDLVGMGSEAIGGLGEIPHAELPAFLARYRFFFNPIRYTSLGLAVCEAMMVGLPIVGLATTELATAVRNGVSGYTDTSVDRLMQRMQELITNPDQARALSEGARRHAAQHYGIERFVGDWERALERAAALAQAVEPATSPSNRSGAGR